MNWIGLNVDDADTEENVRFTKGQIVKFKAVVEYVNNPWHKAVEAFVRILDDLGGIVCQSFSSALGLVKKGLGTKLVLS